MDHNLIVAVLNVRELRFRPRISSEKLAVRPTHRVENGIVWMQWWGFDLKRPRSRQGYFLVNLEKEVSLDTAEADKVLTHHWTKMFPLPETKFINDVPRNRHP